MTKPAVPPPAHHHVIEIDAMDVAEWESGQSTPQASDANIAELVRKTASLPAQPARAQTVARNRAHTQTGAPALSRPPSPARTAPPGPAPKPARPPASGGGLPAPPARMTRVPDISAGPAVEPQRSPAPTPSSGIDFSLPVTATGKNEARRPEPRRSPAPDSRATGPSMPVLETSPKASSEPPQPRTAASSGAGWSRTAATATATSESGARLPELEPPPAPARSPFAEPSRVGPGHNASPAGSADPNTAWPPRPIPVDARSQAVRQAPDAAMLPPRREGAGGADRRKVALTRRRLGWIGGGLAATSFAVVTAAALLSNPEALPPAASVDARGQPAVQAPGQRPERPADQTATGPHEPARSARDGAPEPVGAAAAPAAVSTVDRQPARPTLAEPDTSTEPAAAGASRPGPPGKKPAARKVVVDYTVRPDEIPPPSLVAQSAEDPAIGKARSAYTTGNQRLFVGDLAGAIRAYRQALGVYPGYVGGYRGLGLAYEELGDTASALTAFRAYAAAVPHARDIALIKKRIAHLQRR
jgi:hypothetical protein